MSRSWRVALTASLALFGCLALGWQVVNRDGGDYWPSSIVASCMAGQRLCTVSNILEREKAFYPAASLMRSADMLLPKDARVFLQGMVGSTNLTAQSYLAFALATYYLFPREIGVSLDRLAQLTVSGFLGRPAASDPELLAAGYDVSISLAPDGDVQMKSLHKMPVGNLTDPEWFSRCLERIIAFLLPLLTALAGMELTHLLFPSPGGRMPLLEQLACGFGLGMIALAATTLAVKLVGLPDRGLVLLITTAGALLGVWRHWGEFRTGLFGSLARAVRNPFVLLALLVFLVLFRLAGLLGLVEFDAIMAWALKAKILHLYTGNELVQWFSDPRLAHAHLDYPTLMPSLHAATYDALGHVDEFVTKFWPVWMLLFLIAALGSLNRSRRSWLHAPYFFLVGLLLLPATLEYAQMEGATMPMVFFTALGLVQCAVGLAERDRARLGLGLTLLFGAAMTKFEGWIFLVAALASLLALPSARPLLRPSPRVLGVLAFWLLTALPFLCLRARITVVNFESGWLACALSHPLLTLWTWPRIFGVVLAQQFVNLGFANWGIEAGRLHWLGKWEGFSSLYNHSTLGLAWLSLLMTLGVWFGAPARRPVILWTVGTAAGALLMLTGVLASFAGLRTPAGVLSTFATAEAAGRYLFPLLVAWSTTVLTLAFAQAGAVK